jgi:FMN hydrolase / 5-amino-6-(5-phospho-D-ribitylamino)uracil phosphatase
MNLRFSLITFDLDDTLWDVRPVLVKAEQRVEAWLRINCPLVLQRYDRKALMQLRLRLLDEQPALRHRISDLRREAMRLALLEAGYAPAFASDAAEQAFLEFIAARHDVEPFEEVEASLATLARERTLGALTNGNADVFRMALGRFFSFAVRAEQLNASKPAAEPFQAALRNAGVEPARAIHVGDHHEHDILGAQQLGITAVWFNPGRQQWQGTGEPDAQFAHFSELPALIAALEERGD